MPRTRRRSAPEEALHRAVTAYLAVALPEEAVVFHVPNGFRRSKAEAGIAKALGQLAGFPDIGIAWQGRLYLIELKAPAGRLSEAQRETQGRLSAAGCAVSTERSVDGVDACLRGWGIPLRARAAA